MRRWHRYFSCGVVLSVVLAHGISGLAAQPAQKPPAKIVTPQSQPAVQEKSKASASAQSQDTTSAPQTTASVPAAGGSWRVECSSDGKVLDCRAVQQVVTRDSQQLVAGLTVRVPGETKKPVMMVQLPLGVSVSEPVGFAVDEQKPEQFKIQTCNQQGCFVGSPLADGLLAAMQSGKQLRIVFQNANTQAVTVTMPLVGFTLAYDKIKS
jgi:invasion protein IalB